MTNTAENQDLNQQQILDFIKNNPDWLENQPELMDLMTVKSESGTISLAERQLQNLRKENAQLKHDIGLYLANARDNEQLLNTTFDFCLELLLCQNGQQLNDYMQDRCQRLFQLPQMRLYLRQDDADSWQSEQQALREALGDNMPGSEIITGRLVSSAKSFLFGESDAVASVALIPIGDNCQDGLLALGSSDEQHFDPQKGDLFLQLIAKSLISWCQQQDN